MCTCVIHDDLLYVGELDGYVHCFEARTGKHLWEIDLRAGVWASPYWVDNKIFIGNEDGDLTVFAPGREVKKLATVTVGPAVKTPVKVVDGVLYLQTDAYLYAIGKK